MGRQGKACDLHPLRGPVQEISLHEIAKRAGVTPLQLQEIFRRQALEPTYSIEETAARFGCERTQIHELINLGKIHGRELHPIRGGLYPTFKPSHKSRRIPLSAIERHEAHMARVHDHVDLRRAS